MNLTTIEVFVRAGELGLKLGVEPPDTLTVQPIERCPPDFAETLRAHKSALLSLLALPFVMVRSQALDGEIVFFCEDDATRDALVKAGSEEWRVYTKAELRILCEQNRIRPFSPQELHKVHEIRKTFDAKITDRS
jgi:hypothetical protein